MLLLKYFQIKQLYTAIQEDSVVQVDNETYWGKLTWAVTNSTLGKNP